MLHKQYMVMQGSDLDELEAEVNAALSEVGDNWELYGNMIIDKGQFYQPMINAVNI